MGEQSNGSGRCNVRHGALRQDQDARRYVDRSLVFEDRRHQGEAQHLGLRGHLDAALAQSKAKHRIGVVTIVVYDLPNRDCASSASAGELSVAADGLNRYKHEYVDPIATILADPKYAPLRIVAILEPDSLPNLVTNVGLVPPLTPPAQV